MPFTSKAQARAAFSGALGREMKKKADSWAHETPGGIASLPEKLDRRRVAGLGHTRHQLRTGRRGR